MNPKLLQHFIKKYFANINADDYEFENMAHLDACDDLTFTGRIERNYCYWHEVEFNYLNKNFVGITSLNYQGFYFYTPAIMYQVLEDFDERKNDVSLIWWLYELDEEIVGEKFLTNLSLFNKEQLLIIILFLQKLIPSGIVDEQKFINIITAIENLILTQP